jgi:hypothetical protein
MLSERQRTLAIWQYATDMNMSGRVYSRTVFMTWKVVSERSDHEGTHCVKKCVSMRSSFLACVCSTISSGTSATENTTAA